MGRYKTGQHVERLGDWWSLERSTACQTRHITFTYTTPITGSLAVKAQYVLVLNSMVSTAAALEVDFPGSIPMPPAPASITVPGNPSPVDIDVPGKNGGFAGTVSLWDGTKQIPSLNDPATGGVWAVNPQTGHVTFTFPANITGTVTVKAQYVLVLNGFVSAPGALEIDFVPPPGTPGNLSMSNGSRTDFSLFNIPASNPGLLMPGDTIQLVSGTSLVSTLTAMDSTNTVTYGTCASRIRQFGRVHAANPLHAARCHGLVCHPSRANSIRRGDLDTYVHQDAGSLPLLHHIHGSQRHHGRQSPDFDRNS